MAVSIVMPRLGDFMMEGTVTRLAKSPGEQVSQGEIIAEIETEKLNYDLEATGNGIFHPIVPEGTVVPVDGVLGYLLADGESPPEAPASRPGPAAATTTAPSRPTVPRTPGAVVPSTPGARRLAAKLGVDISEVTPTGPSGRVVDADVRAYAEGQGAKQETPTVPRGLPTPSQTIPLTGMRKGIAEHMRGSIANTAQLSFFIEADVTEAQQLRKETAGATGKSIAMAHVLIRACAEALKRVPAVNTVLSSGNVLHFDEVNIGVAAALGDGLIVPVIKNAEQKDILQIADETSELSAKARDGKLSPDDVLGGTFTISVLGIVDGFTPILNAGQSAILGVGRGVEKPVVKGGEIVIREMMTFSLTTDHQVIDGAVAATFLRRFQQAIERPAGLFK